MTLNTAQQIQWLREHFDYSGEDKTLPFVRKISYGPRGCFKQGTPVGCRCLSSKSDGYARLRIGPRPGILLLMSRAVWMYHYGEIPEGLTIDHIDVDKFNNTIENLRTVTMQENCHNHKNACAHNVTSGHLGVYVRHDCPKRPYFARIGVTLNGKTVQRKTRQFTQLEDAIKARADLVATYHPSCPSHK